MKTVEVQAVAKFIRGCAKYEDETLYSSGVIINEVNEMADRLEHLVEIGDVSAMELLKIDDLVEEYYYIML